MTPSFLSCLFTGGGDGGGGGGGGSEQNKRKNQQQNNNSEHRLSSLAILFSSERERERERERRWGAGMLTQHATRLALPATGH